MDIFDAAEDAAESFAEDLIETGLPTAELLGAVANATDDPVGSCVRIAEFLVPAIGLGNAGLSAFSGEPNVAGAQGLPLLVSALAVVKSMLDDCGTDTPDDGEDFRRGSGALATIADELDGMDAPEGWIGPAAEAYTFANQLQQDGVAALAGVDDRMQRALAAQAADVTRIRNELGDCANDLNRYIPLALVAKAVPRIGELAAFRIQIDAIQTVMPRVGTQYYQFRQRISDHAAEVQSATNAYHSVRADHAGKTPQFHGQLVGIDATGMRHLASDHDRTATSLRATTNMTDTVVDRVRRTHGVACDPTSHALADAVDARTETVASFGKRSKNLSLSLDEGAAHYRATSHEAVQKLQVAMRPSLKDLGHP